MSTRLSLSHFQFQHNFMHWLGAAGRVAPAKYWLMIAVVLVAVVGIGRQFTVLASAG